MKNNVLPKRMTAHLCRGANSPVVRCIWGVCQTPGYCWGHCILIPYQFNGIVLVQRYFIVSADSVHCIRIGIRGGRGGTTMSMIQNNDVLSPETCTNPYPNGVAIEWLWSVDGVHYFHRPECTLQCHSDLMEWYCSGIGVA